LLRHGLLRGSFVPSPEQRQLRDLSRHRTRLVPEHGRVINRLQKMLEDANGKLAAVVTDVGASPLGPTWRRWSPVRPIRRRRRTWRGRLRAKRELLIRAIVGRFTAHHAILITEHLSQFDYPKEVMERVSAEIAQRLQAEHEAVDLIDTVPGIG
jgi:transposase